MRKPMWVTGRFGPHASFTPFAPLVSLGMLKCGVMPGYFSEADELNDLGGSFQIRSLLGVGYKLDNGNKVSLAITRKSNASTQEDNPGVNALLFRYHFAF